jgi:hypothetical protein
MLHDSTPLTGDACERLERAAATQPAQAARFEALCPPPEPRPSPVVRTVKALAKVVRRKIS